MTNVDLTNCDREPIHIPGRIQNHGFLLATDDEFIIRFCSGNVQEFIGIDPASLLGKHISEAEAFIKKPKTQAGYLHQLILLGSVEQPFRTMTTAVTIGDEAYMLIVNSADGHYLLEFEPERADLDADLQNHVGRSLSEMLGDRQLNLLLNNAANQIKQVIGYDRVMIYMFHEDGHGEVVAESRNEELPSWLGLHYPASDIPKQARELYKLNLVRLIADVQSTPSDLLTFNEDTATSLNLTNSTLRAVSPIHIQYLKNMKVASSFSVSILDQQNLWGLIACHHYSPRFINFRQRESAKLIGQVLSSAISFRHQEEIQQKQAQMRNSIEGITRQLLRNTPVPETLFKNDEMQQAVSSTGAVLYFENELNTSGIVPDAGFIDDLIDWLAENTSDIYHTTNLQTAFPNAAKITGIACGLLAVRLSADLKEFLIWFRPEVLATVKWAGNPEKPAEIDETGFTHISPRHSFEVWAQDIRNHSVAWANEEIETAVMLRDEINYAISRRATELRQLNEKLRDAYAELDAFSYTISHDLKNPLTTIKSYSQLIGRNADTDKRVKDMAGRIEAGAQRMQQMIEEVLHYSRVTQEKLNSRVINMPRLLEDIRHDLLVATDNPDLEIEIGQTPALLGDETMVLQVFSNLIGNAVKYSGKSEKPLVKISGQILKDNYVEYSISDNGIGIDSHDQERIFDLFSRAKNVDDFDGTGVGLAIVKRIMEKHQGRIWVDSVPGKGSTFFILFKRDNLN